MISHPTFSNALTTATSSRPSGRGSPKTTKLTQIWLWALGIITAAFFLETTSRDQNWGRRSYRKSSRLQRLSMPCHRQLDFGFLHIGRNKKVQGSSRRENGKLLTHFCKKKTNAKVKYLLCKWQTANHSRLSLFANCLCWMQTSKIGHQNCEIDWKIPFCVLCLVLAHFFFFSIFWNV